MPCPSLAAQIGPHLRSVHANSVHGHTAGIQKPDSDPRTLGSLAQTQGPPPSPLPAARGRGAPGPGDKTLTRSSTGKKLRECRSGRGRRAPGAVLRALSQVLHTRHSRAAELLHLPFERKRRLRQERTLLSKKGRALGTGLAAGEPSHSEAGGRSEDRASYLGRPGPPASRSGEVSAGIRGRGLASSGPHRQPRPQRFPRLGTQLTLAPPPSPRRRRWRR